MVGIEKIVTYSKNSKELKYALTILKQRITEMEKSNECNQSNEKCTEYAYLNRLQLVANNKYEKSFKSRF